jgi:hypothetical protein
VVSFLRTPASRRQLRYQEAAERADRNRLLKLRRHKTDEGTAHRALTFIRKCAAGAGSGTLVTVGKVSGILTAAHVSGQSPGSGPGRDCRIPG